MTNFRVVSVAGEEITQSLFGGNFLFTRDKLGDAGTFDELSDTLGTENLRYPGGSITERLFDISNPDRTSAYDYKKDDVVDTLPLSEFFDFAEQFDKSVTIVLPTRLSLSDDADANGDRYADFDEDLLSKFVQDVVSGIYGNVEIDAFEIGNEYWGAGEMTTVEYGRLSSRMTEVINDSLDKISLSHPEAKDVDIVVQMGTNFKYASLDEEYENLPTSDEVLDQLSDDYKMVFDETALFSSGEINWTKVANFQILNEFDSVSEIEGLDAVAGHVYSRELAVPGSRNFVLDTIDATWLEKYPELKTYVTEWNQKGGTEALGEGDYGLKQAHEILNILEEFSEHGVDVAHVWPLSQNTPNALSRGFEFDELSPAGEMFKMTEEELPGTTALKFSGSESSQTEVSSNGIDVHAFASTDKLVFYLASTNDSPSSTVLDVQQLFSSATSVSAKYLGVQDGDNPGNINVKATIDELSQGEIDSEFYIDGLLQVDLDPFEILQVVVEEPIWSGEMEGILNTYMDDDCDVQDTNQDDSEDDGPLLTDYPAIEPEILCDEVNDEGEFEESDGPAGIEWLLALLPLLALAGI